MTDLYDPYPELPQIPPGLRIDPDDLTPDALTPVTTHEQSERALRALETIVATHIGHRGQRVVDAVVNDVWLHLWQSIDHALSDSERFLSEHRGDVTPHD
ncbi:hypothetical protein [Mycobacteroides abscessus]|uniref:hypothetical protein n=1 Tax=Mycobacteroides abscessus TaxID=36809 RepID=UPI0009266CE5|nr:hypothetical protein [Mycobacteroides abscessus]SIE26692.1 Uncharacterised protein [Mycobacteroides abscessus subsp. abscessus]SIE51311.1 Uncharacterised protein [Mycobacteroides abscessus subsp. abscessus]